MLLNGGNFFHIYNRGNNKQTIFFRERNYDYFLHKVRKYWSIHDNIVAWCLMPNHFHFLVQANESANRIVKQKPVGVNAFTEGTRLLLSSYTKAIQKQESLIGNLFQQKTKCKCVDGFESVVLHYIHQNPLRAKLVDRMEDWKWSSFREYIGISSERISNKEIAYDHLGVNEGSFLSDSYAPIEENVAKLFL
jgi:putative transposase